MNDKKFDSFGSTSSSQPQSTGGGKIKIFDKFNLTKGASSALAANAQATTDAFNAKQAIATRLASVLPTSGSPIKIIEAFISVNDMVGLDRYLKKHQIRKDILNLALQKALIQNREEAVNCLAENGADTRVTDQFGTTRIHFAMRGGGKPEVIIALVRHDANYKDWNQDGNYLIHWACQNESLDLVKLLISKDKCCLNEPDGRGRLPLHVAAMHGRPKTLEYLLQVLSNELDNERVPKNYLTMIQEFEMSETTEGTPTQGAERKKKFKEIKTMAAANYLDDQMWTPMHHANTEEASNDYEACIKLLLSCGADLMLQTPQGKTPLDLAYGAGRSKVLIDILPTARLIALLQRIDDIIPQGARDKREDRTASSILRSSTMNKSPEVQEMPKLRNQSIQRNASMARHCFEKKEDKIESFMHSTLWRKILLNDDVELLEVLRNSGSWRKWQRDENFWSNDPSKKSDYFSMKRVDDFETSQGLSQQQMVEMFQDCYENGLGLYAYIQTYYGQMIRKSKNLFEVLKALTGLDCHKKLTTIDGVQLFRPFHSSILFLSLICGRFKVAEMLLRMRQFDILPVSMLIAFILRNIKNDPRFPENIRSELEAFANLAEGIAVDVLSQVYLKDNTPKKSICRDFLNVPLKSYGDIALIDLCAKAQCSALLSLSCSQSVLDERWDGVLLFLSKPSKFLVRIIPPAGLIYINALVKQQRVKAVSEAFSNNMNISVTTTNSNVLLGPGQSKSTLDTVVTSAGQAGVFTKLRRPKVHTILDEMATQYGWRSASSLNFFFALLRCPSVKFLYHSLCHVIFLIIFSYTLLVEFYIDITVCETISLLYILGYALEEGRQIGIEYLRDGCSKYLGDMWNWSDLAAIFFSMIGFFLRIKLSFIEIPHETMDSKERFNKIAEDSYLPRLFYLCALSVFYLRTLYITSIMKIIGPRLKMMIEMMKRDLLPLLVVFFIFIVQFAVFSQAIMYPNMLDENGPLLYSEILEKAFIRAFYCIFEVTTVFDKSENSYSKGKDFVQIFLMVIYIVSVNLILLNLVIALFSNTVSRIEEQSTAHWLAERYEMVMEFHDRSIFPPPFNIFSIIYEIIWFINSRKSCCKPCADKNSKKKLSEDEKKKAAFNTKTLTFHDSSESGSDSDCLKVNKMPSLEEGPNKKKKKKKKIDTRRFMTENDIQWFSGMRSRAADLSLKFILVQSFSLKNKRQDLGFMTSSASFFKNEKFAASIDDNNANMDLKTTKANNMNYGDLEAKILNLDIKIEKILLSLTKQEERAGNSPRPSFRNVILNPVPISDRISPKFETNKNIKFQLPNELKPKNLRRTSTVPTEEMNASKLEMKLNTPP